MIPCPGGAPALPESNSHEGPGLTRGLFSWRGDWQQSGQDGFMRGLFRDSVGRKLDVLNRMRKNSKKIVSKMPLHRFSPYARAQDFSNGGKELLLTPKVGAGLWGKKEPRRFASISNRCRDSEVKSRKKRTRMRDKKQSIWGVLILFALILAGCSNDGVTPPPPTMEEGWRPQYPDPFGVTILATMMSDNDWWALGNCGAIYKSEDLGGNWELLHHGRDPILYGMSFRDSDFGLAVGGWLALATYDGGDSWEPFTLDCDAMLNEVLFLTSNVGFIICSGSTTSGNGTLLKTTTGGADWIPVDIGNVPGLDRIEFEDEHNGFIVGRNGTYLKTHDGGESWDAHDLGTDKHLKGFDLLNASTFGIVGEEGTILITHDSGASWVDHSIDTHIWLYSLKLIDEDNWLVGGNQGYLMRTSDGGNSWTQVEDRISDTVYSIQIGENGTGFLGGGDVFVTQDFGNTWRVSLEVPLYSLNAVGFYGEGWGVSVGDGGAVLETSDGGESWHREIPITENTLNSVAFSAGGSACAVGGAGTILRSASPGHSWFEVTSHTTNGLSSIDFSDHGPGVIVGERGTILRSSDEGLNWASVNSGVGFDLFEVTCIDSLEFIAAGFSPVLIKSTDGGLSWRQIPSTIDSPTLSIVFSNSYEGIASTSGGDFWRTRDAGENWEKSYEIGGVVYDLDCTPDGMIAGVGSFGNLVWSLDGGDSWGYDTLDWTHHLFGVSVVGEDALVAVGLNQAVFKRSDWRAFIEHQASEAIWNRSWRSQSFP